MKNDNVINILQNLFLKFSRYRTPVIGEIINLIDPNSKGRIQCLIPSLGWTTPDKAAWAFQVDKKGLITPNIGDFVIINFLNADPAYPIIFGKANNIKDQLPKSYDGKATTNILYEGDGTKISIDELLKSIIIEGTFITLKTPDSAPWKPNILPVDPSTGISHTTISNLKGV